MVRYDTRSRLLYFVTGQCRCLYHQSERESERGFAAPPGLPGSGFAVGFALVALLLNHLLPPGAAALPVFTRYLLQAIGGLLAGFITLSLLPAAMFCLGAAYGALASSFLYQLCAHLIPWLCQKVLKVVPEDDKTAFLWLTDPPQMLRIAFFIAVPLACGYVTSRKTFTDLVFAVATAVVGGYCIVLAFNKVWLLGEGKMFTPLWELDKLMSSSLSQMLSTQDERFWILMNVYLVLIGVGIFVQMGGSENAQYRIL